jgi:cell shape-determining protein MreD
METKDYLSVAAFAVMTFAAFIVGIATDNNIVLVAGYLFIVMTQIAYMISYTKTIKREVDSIKELLIKK